jgi:hypothetical protein
MSKIEIVGTQADELRKVAEQFANRKKPEGKAAENEVLNIEGQEVTVIVTKGLSPQVTLKREFIRGGSPVSEIVSIPEEGPVTQSTTVFEGYTPGSRLESVDGTPLEEIDWLGTIIARVNGQE